MNCKVILGRAGDYWFWHCVTCDKEGPSDLDTRSVANKVWEHRLEVAYAPYDKPLEGVSTMSKNIVEIHKELSKLKRELEKIPSADVREFVGLGFDGFPRYAPVSEVRASLNEAWTLLNRVTNLLDDMEVA